MFIGGSVEAHDGPSFAMTSRGREVWLLHATVTDEEGAGILDGMEPEYHHRLLHLSRRIHVPNLSEGHQMSDWNQACVSADQENY